MNGGHWEMRPGAKHADFIADHELVEDVDLPGVLTLEVDGEIVEREIVDAAKLARNRLRVWFADPVD